jgi:hypothetical protein
MKNNLQSALLGVLCGATAFAAMPPEAYAMSAAPPAAVGLAAPVAKVWYRSYCRPYAQRRAYYPRYSYYRPRTVYYSYDYPTYSSGYSYAYPSYGYGYSYPSYGYGYGGGGAAVAGAALGLMGRGRGPRAHGRRHRRRDPPALGRRRRLGRRLGASPPLVTAQSLHPRVGGRLRLPIRS